MDIKQEPLDESELESVDVKEEPLFGEPLLSPKVEPNICEVNLETPCLQKVKMEKETENVNTIHSQINTSRLYTKNNSLFGSKELNMSTYASDILSKIKQEIPEISDSEVQAKDMCLENSDLIKLKQELDIKCELLTEECDLPVVKNEADILNEPCSSRQFLHSVKSNRSRNSRTCFCPVCQKGNDVVKKWGSVKDNFHVKKIKENSSSGSPAKKFKKYHYCNQLLYLMKVARNKTDSSLVKETEENENTSSSSLHTKEMPSLPPGPSRYVPTTRKRSNQVIDDFGAQPLKAMQEKENRHLSFFKGILPSLNDFTELQTLTFQSKVIKIITEMRLGKKT